MTRAWERRSWCGSCIDVWRPATRTGRRRSLDSNQRKAVVPLREHWKGEPRFYWLGLSCYAASDHSPAPVLESSLRYQLRAHARGLLIRRQRKIAASRPRSKRQAQLASCRARASSGPYRAVRRCAGYKEIDRRLQAGASHATGQRQRGGASCERRWRSLDRPSIPTSSSDGGGGGRCTWDADPTMPRSRPSSALLSSRRGVLVITTSWPSALIRQRDEDRGFGVWRDHVAAAHRVQALRLNPLSPATLADIATSAASRTTAAGSVRREAALTLAARANGNPLALSALLKLVSRNGLALRAQDIADLEALPRDPVSSCERNGRSCLTECSACSRSPARSAPPSTSAC